MLIEQVYQIRNLNIDIELTMHTEYRGIKISEDTKFENTDFVDYDFSQSDLTEVVFENVIFRNCTFNKTICKKTRFWGCFFENCMFLKVDLSNTCIGAWGGGQNNCKFVKCKLGKIFEGSYITNAVFDQCKIKGCMFFCLYMAYIRFVGLIDDLMIRKMSVKDIVRYQTPDKARDNIEKILKVINQKEIDVQKVQVTDLDFSMATMQFLDFSECELRNVVLPDDGKYLLIDKNLNEIADCVSEEIDNSWYNPDSKSWALSCVSLVRKKSSIAVICWRDFKHYEDEEFADRLMELFRTAKDKIDSRKVANHQ